jgi:VanZ family protein
MAQHARKDETRTIRHGTAYRAVSWIAVAVWASVIFFMSARTESSLSSGFFGMARDWGVTILNSMFGYHEDPLSPVCHFLEYLVLGMLLCHALGLQTRAGKAALLAIVVASAYGATDELHQIFVGGRTCDPLDWATDTIGAGLGTSLWLLRRKRRL